MRKATAAILGIVGAFALAQGCAVEGSDGEMMTATQALECNPNAGVNPVMAAMAVAMADGMGNIDPLRYFALDNSQYKLVLSAEGQARCNVTGQCNDLMNILGLQEWAAQDYIDQTLLNVADLRNTLYASYERQKNHTENLQRNSPWLLAEPHELAFLGTQQNPGACGTHFEYAARKPGTNTLLDHPENLVNNLVFFGVLSNNEYIDFYATEGEIGIDPTVGLNSALLVSGSCYYAFSVYDPTWFYYNKCCYWAGKYGQFKVAPWAYNTFYCKTS